MSAKIDGQIEFIEHKTICKHKTTVIKYISQRFTYYSEDEWINQINLGRVSVNGRKIHMDKEIFPNDELLCLLEKIDAKEPPIDPNYSILYDDQYLLVVNKSGDIPIHPAGRYRKNTLLTILEADISCKLYPCHRLDRETSGICLFAKNPEAGQKLAKQFQDRKIEKEYRVFVYGEFPEQIVLEGLIETDPNSLIRKKKFLNQVNFPSQSKQDLDFDSSQSSDSTKYSNPLDYKKIAAELQNKKIDKSYAITIFQRLSFREGISQIAAFPLTGRIHQIRASLHSFGFPILGDKIYGRDEKVFLQFIETGWTKEFQEILGHSRQALHAYRLEFLHPVSGEKMKIISALPADLNF